ncbi:MAG TPA: helix-turn-helix transcriptional regulator [Streptosporangiaceae bacterium]
MSHTRHQHSAGEIISRHSHDHHQLIYVSCGVLAITTDAGAWVASAARAIWLPARTWHEHRVYGSSSVHTIAFPAGAPPVPGGSPVVIGVDGLLRELLIACTDPGLPAGETRRIGAVLGDRLRRAHVQPLRLPVARDPRLGRACQLVVEDLREPRTVSWLARRAGVSERTLARLFRSEFGTTYPQWRTSTRVFHAMTCLAEGATVTQTAHRCGWATASAFVDTFTRTMGQTPGAYRAAATRDDLAPAG